MKISRMLLVFMIACAVPHAFCRAAATTSTRAFADSGRTLVRSVSLDSLKAILKKTAPIQTTPIEVINKTDDPILVAYTTPTELDKTQIITQGLTGTLPYNTKSIAVLYPNHVCEMFDGLAPGTVIPITVIPAETESKA